MGELLPTEKAVEGGGGDDSCRCPIPPGAKCREARPRPRFVLTPSAPARTSPEPVLSGNSLGHPRCPWSTRYADRARPGVPLRASPGRRGRQMALVCAAIPLLGLRRSAFVVAHRSALPVADFRPGLANALRGLSQMNPRLVSFPAQTSAELQKCLRATQVLCACFAGIFLRCQIDNIYWRAATSDILTQNLLYGWYLTISG